MVELISRNGWNALTLIGLKKTCSGYFNAISIICFTADINAWLFTEDTSF